jgi:hypothetical protein
MMAAETQATADPVVAELARIRDRAEDEMRHVDRAPEDVPWSCEDVPRLLAALEAVLELHKPVVRCTSRPCDDHRFVSRGLLRPISWQEWRAEVDACTVCTATERQVCATCRNTCPDDDVWPCPTAAVISRALLGEEAGRG